MQSCNSNSNSPRLRDRWAESVIDCALSPCRQMCKSRHTPRGADAATFARPPCSWNTDSPAAVQLAHHAARVTRPVLRSTTSVAGPRVAMASHGCCGATRAATTAAAHSSTSHAVVASASAPPPAVIAPAPASNQLAKPTVTPQFYKRALPRTCIPFASPEGLALFRRALNAGTMESYFPVAEQFRTQVWRRVWLVLALGGACGWRRLHRMGNVAFAQPWFCARVSRSRNVCVCCTRVQDEPAFCGLSTLVVALNTLKIDPGRVWKGVWRWYSEEMVS